jgi:hypothetical protein
VYFFCIIGFWRLLLLCSFSFWLSRLVSDLAPLSLRLCVHYNYSSGYIVDNCSCIFHSFFQLLSFAPLKDRLDTLPPWALTLAEKGHIAKRARARFPTSPRTRFRQRIRPLPLLPSSQLLSITIFPSSFSYHSSWSRRSIVSFSCSLFIHLSFLEPTITTPHQQ